MNVFSSIHNISVMRRKYKLKLKDNNFSWNILDPPCLTMIYLSNKMSVCNFRVLNLAAYLNVSRNSIV